VTIIKSETPLYEGKRKRVNDNLKMVVMLMLFVNRVGDMVVRHGKRRAEHHIENNYRKRVITETPNTLLKSDKFDKSSSNVSSFTASTLITLPPDKLLKSDKPESSLNIAHEEKSSERTNEHLTVELTMVPFPPSFNQSVPFYISEAYSHFASHVNESNELKGLKFIGIISGLRRNPNSYLWHHTENPINSTNEGNQKEFSYSVLRLDKFTKTCEQLKTNQDKWSSLILHGSQMTEKDVDEIFGDEPVFQEVFQILKLENLPSEERKEYHLSEGIRLSAENLLRSDFEKGQQIGQEICRKICREISRERRRKIELEIKRKKSMNEPIVVKEIVEPVIDEIFDDQGILKINLKRHKAVTMEVLKKHGSDIPYSAASLPEKLSREKIEEFKKSIVKKVENWEIVTEA
jgi:hypothetical protein